MLIYFIIVVINNPLCPILLSEDTILLTSISRYIVKSSLMQLYLVSYNKQQSPKQCQQPIEIPLLFSRLRKWLLTETPPAGSSSDHDDVTRRWLSHQREADHCGGEGTLQKYGWHLFNHPVNWCETQTPFPPALFMPCLPFSDLLPCNLVIECSGSTTHHVKWWILRICMKLWVDHSVCD